jgi:hypothetical protein
LNTEGAFLDDAPFSDGDIRIQGLVEGLWEGGTEPVINSYFVRAGTATEPCSNAAIVDLGIETLRRMVGCEDGTYRFTRRLSAVLAEHRHKAGAKVGIFPFPITLNPNPVERTTL